MVTLTASSPASGTVFSWYATATGTTVLATGSSFTAGPITSDTTFYVSAVNTAGCGSAGRGQTTITLLKPLAAPVVTVDNTTAQSVTFKWAAVPGATGYQVTQDGGNTFVVPNGTSGLTHTISGLQPNQSVSIQVRALGAMSCQTSPLSATVTGTATNPLGNSVYVPNVFTPNSDGRNDYFTVFGNNIKDVEMWIFSQWGDMLFHTKDRIGWNGMVGNKLQPVGAYVYVLKITLQDGTILDRKGVINLVR
jgi:gliding motility-associated-like protein